MNYTKHVSSAVLSNFGVSLNESFFFLDLAFKKNRSSENFADALAHARRLRPQLPAIYNPLRQSETPIPRIDTSNDNWQIKEEEVNGQEVADNSLIERKNDDILAQPDADDVIENSENNSPALDQPIEFDTSLTPQETEALVSSSENNECDHVTNAVENPEILQEAAIGEAGNADSFEAMSVPQEDVKPIFQQIQVDEADEEEFNHLFDCERDPLEQEDSAHESVETIDDEVEMAYISLADFKPIMNSDGYEIKAKDLLSNNIPFKRNVCV